jgi:uncharacterized protein YfiM (DUF2279 family)
MPSDSTKIRKGRLIGVSTLVGAGYVGGMTGLYYLWYKDYDQSKFHTINDNAAWLQVDKMGHTFSAYQLSRWTYMGFNWAGLDNKRSSVIGASFGFMFLTTVEIFDGFSANWGFSWGDVAANAVGTTLFLGQQLAWEEQRIQFKFSYWPSDYAKYNTEVLGENFTQRVIKDYNGETFWLSVNPQSFSSSRKIFPKWLNISLGYGATGMTNTYENLPGVYPESKYDRTRQFYLSLDIDLTKIKTNSEFLKLILQAANTLKIPFPTLEYNRVDGVRFHPIYF